MIASPSWLLLRSHSFRASYRSLDKHAVLCHESLSSWTQPPARGTTWSVLAMPAFCHPAWAGALALLNIKPTHLKVHDPRKKWCTGKASPGCMILLSLEPWPSGEERTERKAVFALSCWSWTTGMHGAGHSMHRENLYPDCCGIYFQGGRLLFCPCSQGWYYILHLKKVNKILKQSWEKEWECRAFSSPTNCNNLSLLPSAFTC